MFYVTGRYEKFDAFSYIKRTYQLWILLSIVGSTSMEYSSKHIEIESSDKIRMQRQISS